jgi:hypothetical protein
MIMIEERNIYYEITKIFLSLQNERIEYTALTKTRLIKLAYLTDYFYYKKNQIKLSDIDWVFYLYGPFSYSSNEIISKRPFSIKRLDNGILDPEIIELIIGTRKNCHIFHKN